jgi:uncharacterized protein YndB with AHSA1/START domain
MAKSEFFYVTYIKTTPEKLWKALTTPEFQRQYWVSAHIKTNWKKGSPWQLLFPDGKIADEGTIVDIKPNKRLVLKWKNIWKRGLDKEGYSRCTMEIAPYEKGAVKLTVTHSIAKAKSKLIEAVSGGWPYILSNLKSLLETGKIVVDKKGDCRS